MTGINCELFTHNQSRSYLNHLVDKRGQVLRVFRSSQCPTLTHLSPRLSYTSTPPVCLQCVHKDSFTFTGYSIGTYVYAFGQMRVC